MAEPVGYVVHQCIHPDNGPLRLIPGSHRVNLNPADALPLGCGMGPHPAEVKVVALLPCAAAH